MWQKKKLLHKQDLMTERKYGFNSRVGLHFLLHVEGFCQLQTRLDVSALLLLVVFGMLPFLQIVSKGVLKSALSSPNCSRDTPRQFG